MGTLDVESRIYTSDSGVAIQLLAVPALLIGAMQTDMTDHPHPPIMEVTLGSQKRVMENANDPVFLERVKQWDDARNTAMIRFVLALGTNAPPDPVWVERFSQFIPNPTADNMRVYWLLAQLTNDEANDIFEKIMSLTVPTEKGMAASADRFPSES